ncbi:MAG: nicotinate (nicotinamide) nucleotide adenylyltransferase [Oscillospiraceae bacterium]|nr:nicotinate (nicotinamide) nucleotide adenylyltransferase [Oscillospiraceae bacterium]
MEKLGIFGGTFNPVHNGHLSLCTQLSNALQIPQVLLIPTAVPPHKRAPELADGAQRLAMCRLAAQTDPRFCACDLELRRQGNSYTVETLRELEMLYPHTQFYLLMGTDMFLTVQNWYCAGEIFRRAILVTGARKKGEEEKLTEHLAFLQTLGASGAVIPCQVVEISSTQVRVARKQGRSIREMVPQAVERYIEENGLYLPEEGKVDGNG